MTSLQLLLNKVFVFLLMIVLLPSCGSRDVFNQYKTFTDGNWHSDSIAEFVAEIKDTSLNYNVFLNIRHNQDYPYQNFWLFVECAGADGLVRRDTIAVEVADVYGKWRGKGSASLFQLAVPLSFNRKYDEPGTYEYSLRHAMRDTVLNGIKNIRIRIEKAK